MNPETTILYGKAAIERFTGRNFDRTIRRWIEERGFPASKIDGTWHSDQVLILEWYRGQILQEHSKDFSMKNPG